MKNAGRGATTLERWWIRGGGAKGIERTGK